MKTDKKYRKAVCLFYLIGSYLLLLSLVEAIYFLAIPSLGGIKLYDCSLIWDGYTSVHTSIID